MALNLEEDTVAAVLLGDQRQVNEGDKVKGTGHSVDVPVGDGLLGRVVNALGQPVDEKGPLQAGTPPPGGAGSPWGDGQKIGKHTAAEPGSRPQRPWYPSEEARGN